jgi:hypothetical protein
MTLRPVALLPAVLLVISGALSACSGEGGDAGGATTTPAEVAVSAGSTPGGTSSADAAGERVSYGPVSVVLPPEFATITVPSSGNLTRYGARQEGSSTSDGAAAVLAVVVDSAPIRSVQDEAEASALVERSGAGSLAQDMKVEPIQVPGATTAYRLSYRRPPRDGRPERTVVSVVTESAQGQVVVQAQARADEFESSGLPAAMASLRIE